MKTFQHLIEYISLRSTLFLLDRISLPTAESMAVWLADIWFRLDCRRHRISEQNILLSGITSDQTEATRIARDSFRHFAVLIVESLKSNEFLNEQNWRERVEVNISPATMALLEKPGRPLFSSPVISATGKSPRKWSPISNPWLESPAI